jgi:hypothetical protein
LAAIDRRAVRRELSSHDSWTAVVRRAEKDYFLFLTSIAAFQFLKSAPLSE